MGKLDGKIAIVTGASSGIGWAIAQRFLADGARVIGASRREPEGLAEAAEGRFSWQSTDVSDGASVAALFAAAAEGGGCDILVNNAGIQIEKTLADSSDQDFATLNGVNIQGVFLCSRAAVRQMRGRGGAIVNIGSIAGTVADHGMALYSASKAWVHGFTRAVAVDHGRDGVRCNAICPGWIKTEMTVSAFQMAGDPSGAEAKAVARHPVGRLGEPSDIAALASWLASDEAAFASGQLFTLDGALTAGSPINPEVDG